VLESLFSKGHSLYICSNGSIEYIELVLQRTKISEYFCEKHSAKQYFSKSEAVKNIISSNQSAIIIGDTYSDIEAAINNNIPSIGVTYGYGNKDDISKATFTAENANDILNYISQIEVFYLITQKLINRGKRIIGINGIDTSGKTIFTYKYSKYLDCIGVKNTILHIDDFHNPSEMRYQGENEVEAYYNNAFNYYQIINEILKPLQINGFIDKNVLCLNLDTDKFENNIHFDINSKTILLIEGVLLFRKPMLEYLEGKIFLHIDFDEVIDRATLRDVPKYGIEFLQKYKDKYIPIQKLYLSEHTPEQISDIVINNNDYLNPTILSTIQ
jgi:phosphoglycolate phosphatase